MPIFTQTFTVIKILAPWLIISPDQRPTTPGAAASILFLLLRNPTISAVRISRRFSEQELKARHADWVETVRDNGVLVSPFISAAEKQVRDRAIADGGNIILITREEMEEKFKPSGRMFELCSEGRLLIISTGKAAMSKTISRAEALDMNALAETIASDTRPDFIIRRGEHR